MKRRSTKNFIEQSENELSTGRSAVHYFPALTSDGVRRNPMDDTVNEFVVKRKKLDL